MRDLLLAGHTVRPLNAVMVASIGINLLFAGMILSSYAGMPEHPPRPRFERVIDEVARSLPPDDAAILKQAFALKRPELEEMAGRASAMEERMRDAIRREPVDSGVIHRTVDDAQESQHRFMALMFDTMADASINMSLKGRETLSDWHRHH